MPASRQAASRPAQGRSPAREPRRGKMLGKRAMENEIGAAPSAFREVALRSPEPSRLCVYLISRRAMRGKPRLRGKQAAAGRRAAQPAHGSGGAAGRLFAAVRRDARSRESALNLRQRNHSGIRMT